jgi:hypothetical protein
MRGGDLILTGMSGSGSRGAFLLGTHPPREAALCRPEQVETGHRAGPVFGEDELWAPGEW